MAKKTDNYVSADGSEFIRVSTMQKMERDAGQHGWQFTFSADRSTVTVVWSENVTTTYHLAR